MVDGYTALHQACIGGHWDIAELLLDNGADIEAIKSLTTTSTPLQLACKKGHVPTVELLLQRGANVDRWCLHRICQYGHKSILALLLDHGTNINASDDDNWTPLHLACLFGKPGCVQELLHRGANVNLKNYDGRTALDMAREVGTNQSIIDLFMRYELENRVSSKRETHAADVIHDSNLIDDAEELKAEVAKCASKTFMVCSKIEKVERRFRQLKDDIAHESNEFTEEILDTLERKLVEKEKEAAAMERSYLCSKVEFEQRLKTLQNKIASDRIESKMNLEILQKKLVKKEKEAAMERSYLCSKVEFEQRVKTLQNKIASDRRIESKRNLEILQKKLVKKEKEAAVERSYLCSKIELEQRVKTLQNKIASDRIESKRNFGILENRFVEIKTSESSMEGRPKIEELERRFDELQYQQSYYNDLLSIMICASIALIGWLFVYPCTPRIGRLLCDFSSWSMSGFFSSLFE